MLELDPRWVVGFVDGEGCFSVSVHRNLNAESTGGWQLHPVFHVYQHERYRAVLEALDRRVRLRTTSSEGAEQQRVDVRGRRVSSISRHTSCRSSSAIRCVVKR